MPSADTPRRSLIPLLARTAALAVALLIPLRILNQGFLPYDDALRHAGKAVSGRAWSELLVLRPGVAPDSHPGWHALLGALHSLTGWSPLALVLFSVTALFVLFCLPALGLLRRPEAWLSALLLLALTDPALLARLFMGRPLLWSASTLLVVCLFLPRLQSETRAPWGLITALTALVGLAVWIHPSWYLWGLPVAACLLARHFRAGSRLALVVALGAFVGSCLAGNPFTALMQGLRHGFLSVDFRAPGASLVAEFQPQTGSVLFVAAVAALVFWRVLRGPWSRTVVDTPVFWLAGLGWTLGFVSLRFWSDWGLPAALLWMAIELQEALEEEAAAASAARFWTAAAACLVSFLAITADMQGRWSQVDRSYAAVFAAAGPEDLPGPGGILYSDDMRLFYQGLYLRPQAPWRYQLGYEPGLMPPEDLAAYRAIAQNRSPEAFAFWVSKMRAEDRLVLKTASPDVPPAIGGLQWHALTLGYWSGRRPR